ncbi:DMT family transporter [Paracidovorax citrulli]
MILQRLAHGARSTLSALRVRSARSDNSTVNGGQPAAWRDAAVAHGSTALFVLLWSSGAIVGKWGLTYASAFAFLTLRFLLAFGVLLLIAAWRRRWLPERGQRRQVALVGFLLTGCYSICYLLALDRGVTPGMLATLLGAQPILTLLLTERRFSALRLLGLLMALAGLVMVVYQGLGIAGTPVAGMLFALAALASMTVGAIAQKAVSQAPIDILPLQYGIALLMCLALLPFEQVHVQMVPQMLLPLGWMALVISIGATLLLYRMIQGGNLVNVTSLFYLVPAGTAVLDYLVYGNRLAGLALAGMVTILAGLALVFRQPARR